jgi:hypothetical protein
MHKEITGPKARPFAGNGIGASRPVLAAFYWRFSRMLALLHDELNVIGF